MDNHREEWFSVAGSRWSGLASISRFVNARYLKPWEIERQTFSTDRQRSSKNDGKTTNGQPAGWMTMEREEAETRRQAGRERSRARTRAFGSKSITGGKPFCGNVNNYRAAIKICSLFPFPPPPHTPSRFLVKL